MILLPLFKIQSFHEIPTRLYVFIRYSNTLLSIWLLWDYGLTGQNKCFLLSNPLIFYKRIISSFWSLCILREVLHSSVDTFSLIWSHWRLKLVVTFVSVEALMRRTQINFVPVCLSLIVCGWIISLKYPRGTNLWRIQKTLLSLTSWAWMEVLIIRVIPMCAWICVCVCAHVPPCGGDSLLVLWHLDNVQTDYAYLTCLHSMECTCDENCPALWVLRAWTAQAFLSWWL